MHFLSKFIVFILLMCCRYVHRTEDITNAVQSLLAILDDDKFGQKLAAISSQVGFTHLLLLSRCQLFLLTVFEGSGMGGQSFNVSGG